MKTLADGAQMLAAFPNAQGRLLVLVRVLRQGDRFLFETEEATREKLFANLFRFTYAGDFLLRICRTVCNFEIFGPAEDVYHRNVGERFPGAIAFEQPHGASYFMPTDLVNEFSNT